MGRWCVCQFHHFRTDVKPHSKGKLDYSREASARTAPSADNGQGFRLSIAHENPFAANFDGSTLRDGLRDVRLAEALPPHLRVIGLVEHLGEFLLDLAQLIGAQLKSGLIVLAVKAILADQGIRVAQRSNFPAKAGEVL